MEQPTKVIVQIGPARQLEPAVFAWATNESNRAICSKYLDTMMRSRCDNAEPQEYLGCFEKDRGFVAEAHGFIHTVGQERAFRPDNLSVPRSSVHGACPCGGAS